MKKMYLLALQMIFAWSFVYGMVYPDNLTYNSAWKDESFFYSFERDDDTLDIKKFKGGWYGYGYFEESGSGAVMLDAGVYLFQVGADDEATLTIDGVTSEIRGTHAITWGNWARLDISSKRLCQYDWTFNNKGHDLYELDYQFWKSKTIPLASITMDGVTSSGPVIGRVKVSKSNASSPPTTVTFMINEYNPDVTYSVGIDEEVFKFVESNIVTSNGIGEIIFYDNLVCEQVDNGNNIITLRLCQSYKGVYDNSRIYQIELYTEEPLPLTLTAESANWSEGSITLCCDDRCMTTDSRYTLFYYDDKQTCWNIVDSARDQHGDADGKIHLTDTKFASRLGGIVPVQYQVICNDERSSETCVTRNRHGIFVGVGEYGPDYHNLTELKSAPEEASLFKKLAVEHGGCSDPHLLTNQGATYSAVDNAFKVVAAKTKNNPGDICVVYFSTHGGVWGGGDDGWKSCSL